MPRLTARASAEAQFKKSDDLQSRIVDALRIEQIAFDAKMNNMRRLRAQRLVQKAFEGK